MQKLNWEPLEERRARIKLLMFYKARQNQVSLPIHHLIPRTAETRNCAESYVIPGAGLNSHQNSFFPSTVRLWNALPAEIKNSKNVDLFKENLNKVVSRSTYSFDLTCTPLLSSNQVKKV